MGEQAPPKTTGESDARPAPVAPLRDVVVYPHMVVPLFVGREASIQALDRAMHSDKSLVLLTQKNADLDVPGPDEVFRMGTLATILQMLKLPDGTVKVLVEGQRRAQVERFEDPASVFSAWISLSEPDRSKEDPHTIEVLGRSVLDVFEKYVNLHKKVSSDVLAPIKDIQDPERLSDLIAAHLVLKLEEKQRILEIQGVQERLEHLLNRIEGEIDVMEVEKKIRVRVKKQMDRSHREYYLNEQMKAIQKELGDSEDAPGEIEELGAKIVKARMPKEAKKKAEAELKKLKQMPPMSAEATVVRNYIDTLINVPWRKRSKVRKDLGEAGQVLEEDHYGLEKVKERILEYLAVQHRVKDLRGPILCLVGPPGVGKTSIGRSIARATARRFIRMSLGGVRDEAEIRGHRRTYIGALPGKIVHNMSKAGVKNPLFLLDEIDKMSMDFRGDPSSALLEVLDPEQNHAFNDHYLEVDFDLSEVMFVATANSMNIPAPLLDRMEVIRIAGYTEDEKVNIAQRYLLPKQQERNGLSDGELGLDEAALRDVIRHYTREAGVRSLERELSTLCRKVVKQNVLDQTEKNIEVTAENLEKYLGVQRYRYGEADELDRIGQVTGLAWTEVGGELLSIETAIVPGKGKFSYTGSLGDVMQESIQAAMIVVRSRSERLGVKPEFHAKHDIHVHVPEGATPKDGPSAGIGMCAALVSALTRIPVRADVAMTGEITLRGEVLPIGGLKEKLLAAHRGGLKTVLIPEDNVKDLADIPKNIQDKLDIRSVRWIDEVLEISLKSSPLMISDKEPEAEKIAPIPLQKDPVHESPLRHH